MGKKIHQKAMFSKKPVKRKFGSGLWVDIMTHMKEFRQNSKRRRTFAAA